MILRTKNGRRFIGKPLSVAIAIAMVPITHAQEAAPAIEEVLVVGLGSRIPGRTSADLPVPVDTLTSEALENTGQVEVGRMLQSLAPSFNFPSSSISDGTDALRPATLRGLGPDQTLVLINGKRRHQSALIHINTSVGRGTAGTDLNAIPAASIQRIEVLRDGAAAQYGSDAIAGVINIVLKESEEGKVSLSYGQYTEGDGETLNIDINKGFTLGSDGFVNLTANFRDRGYTNRAGQHGSCLYATPCLDSDSNGIVEAGDSREVTANRTTFRIGDAESQQIGFALNAKKGLGNGEAYGFFTYSNRANESAAFFRHPGNSGGNPPLNDGDAVIANGFLPKIDSEIIDISIDAGYKIEYNNNSTLDFSYTYGKNTIDYDTLDSVNASYVNTLRYGHNLSDADIRANVPREANAYALELDLTTLNIDYTHTIGDLGYAAGAELRKDNYQVTPGDEYAYRDYDTVNGNNLYTGNGDAGIQGFPGISPVSAVSESRSVMSLYIDTEYDITNNLMVSGALRYDNFEDFGDTFNYKLAANWAITDIFRLRGAVSTGFRAPSMQQLYFNNVGTQFVTNPDDPSGPQIAVQRGTFRNDSALAGAIGIPELKEEESQNYSFGFVLEPLNDMTITIDYYQIDIDDRIVISKGLGKGLSTELDDALDTAGASEGQFFLNGADTETSGVDIVLTYDDIEIGDGILDISLAGNFTETEVVSLFTPIADVNATDIFSEQDISIIEEWQPKDRVNLTGNYFYGNFSTTLAFNRYGEYTITDGGTQTYSAEVLTDLSIRYDMDNGVSFNIGGNNIFDVTPDENTIGNSRTGTIEDGPSGNIIVASPGVFTYSRRSAPFGFNGAYVYAGIAYNF